MCLAWGVVPLPLFRRFSAIAMGWPATRGKGSPSTNAAERALLEGYRMGVNSSASAGGKGLALGKGGGKGGKQGKGHAEPPAMTDRTCQREGCRAAIHQQATWGGGTQCHCCGLSLLATVPVQQLVGWAWQLRLQAQADKAKVQANGAAAQPQPADAAAWAAPGAAPSTDGLLTLRNERLALLKAAAATGKVTEPPPTALQEVAKVFVDAASPNAKVTVDVDLETALVSLDQRAQGVLTSLQAECYPANSPLREPSEIVTALLAKSSRAIEGKSQAEQALQTTRATMVTMRSGGASDSDEVLALLIKRETRQAKELQKLDDKSPSQELRKSTLVSIRADYAEAATALTDSRTRGATKALERAQARTKTIDAIVVAAKLLKERAEEVRDELYAAHTARAQLKEAQAAEVLQLIDEKIDDLDLEDVVILDAEPEVATTSTEDDRDEARRLSTLLEQQLRQFQQAATTQKQLAEQEAASAQAASAAQPTAQQAWHDLHLEFAAEPQQLPSHDTVSDELKTAATNLNALLKAVPWGYTLPSLQFAHLAVPPSLVHGLVGDAIWKSCWSDRHAAINDQHAVPYKLLNILKTVAQHVAQTPSDAQVTAAKERYAAAVRDADTRRRTGGPY